jgi:hypothetical protein
MCHTSHLTPHTSHLTPHTSHLTPHTSHLTPHTSHLTPHTSHRSALAAVGQQPRDGDEEGCAPPDAARVLLVWVLDCLAFISVISVRSGGGNEEASRHLSEAFGIMNSRSFFQQSQIAVSPIRHLSSPSPSAAAAAAAAASNAVASAYLARDWSMMCAHASFVVAAINGTGRLQHHVTLHTSHLTPHTSHLTPHNLFVASARKTAFKAVEVRRM